MVKTNTSTFKARLGKYMKAVRAGQTVILTDRDRPVAKLVPLEKEAPARLEIVLRNPAAPPISQATVKGIPYRGTNSTELLAEDRARR